MSKPKIETLMNEVEKQFKIYKKWDCTLFRRDLRNDSWFEDYCESIANTEPSYTKKDRERFLSWMERMVECCRVIPVGKEAGSIVGLYEDITNRLKFDPECTPEKLNTFNTLSIHADIACDGYIHEPWRISKEVCSNKSILDMCVTSKREKKAASRADGLSFMLSAHRDGTLHKSLDCINTRISLIVGDRRIFNLISILKKWESWQCKMDRIVLSTYDTSTHNAITALPYMHGLPDGDSFIYRAIAEICTTMKDKNSAKELNRDTVDRLLKSSYQ